MNAAQLENARLSTAAVHNRQHLAAAMARRRLIDALSFEQYQACRVEGFFQLDRVAKVTKSKRLNLLAAEAIYTAKQLRETSQELDAILACIDTPALVDWTFIQAQETI